MPKYTNLHAVISAAGRGSRAMPMSDSINKVLIPINGYPLLWHSIENLLDVGVKKILIVVGYKSHLVTKSVKYRFPNSDIQFIHNDQYETANNVTSYMLSRQFINNHNYFRMEGDLIYTKNILLHLMDTDKPITVATRKKDIFTGDEFRIEVDRQNHTIKNFGKTIPLSKAYGESKGIEFISKSASVLVSNNLDPNIIGDNLDKFSEYAYQLIINKNSNYVFYKDLTNDDHWDELDTLDDLSYICKVYDQKYVK